MSVPKVFPSAGGASLQDALDAVAPFFRALLPRRAALAPAVALLSTRQLAFDVHPIDARPEIQSAVYAFAHPYGARWWVLYLGATANGLGTALRHHHLIREARGRGATHLLVRPRLPYLAFDEHAGLIRDLAPPLNEL